MQSHASYARLRIFGGEYAAGDVRASVLFVVNRDRQRIQINLLAGSQDDLLHRSVFDATRFADGAASLTVSVQQFLFASQAEGERQAFFGPDEITDNLRRIAFDVLELKRRPVRAIGLMQKFAQLVAQVDFVGHTEQLAVFLQQAEKVAEIEGRHACYWA